MGKSQLTQEMLEKIETHAQNKYSLKETLHELNISKRFMQDERVLAAFEKGLIKLYISMKATGTSNNAIVKDFEITMQQCLLWEEEYRESIQAAKEKIEYKELQATKQFSDPLVSGMVNLVTQHGTSNQAISHKVLRDDIKAMVKKVRSGDTDDLITMLTTNILQLQLFNTTITQNITGQAGKQLDNFEKLSNIQIKVMQETRKSIMAINEITNPKRTTFIKEATQHNHLHQENSQKILETENKLQSAQHLPSPKHVIDADFTPFQEYAQ